MAFRPKLGDVQVFRREDDAQGVRPHYFSAPSTVERFWLDGVPWLAITFVEGGRVEIPEATCVWIEPERH